MFLCLTVSKSAAVPTGVTVRYVHPGSSPQQTNDTAQTEENNQNLKLKVTKQRHCCAEFSFGKSAWSHCYLHHLSRRMETADRMGAHMHTSHLSWISILSWPSSAEGTFGRSCCPDFFLPNEWIFASGCILEVSKKFSNGEETIQAIRLKLVSLHLR